MPDESEQDKSKAAERDKPADRIGWVAPEDYPAEQRVSSPEAPGWAEQDAGSEQGTETQEKAPSAPRAAPEASGSSRTSRRS